MDALTLIGGTKEVAIRLAVAALVGAAIGLNREFHDKPAGVRTHALVGMGAALMTLTGLLIGINGTVSDPAGVSRIIQGVVTGIGFIGAGVILRDDSRQTVHGLTTAATIWIVAGFGIACGAGQWQAALVALAFTLLILVFGGPFEKAMHRRFGSRDDSRPV